MQKYWRTPPALVLSTPGKVDPGQECMIDVVSAFLRLGYGVNLVSVSEAPQVYEYHMSIDDATQLRALMRCGDVLGCLLHAEGCAITPSVDSDFLVSVPRRNRGAVYLGDVQHGAESVRTLANLGISTAGKIVSVNIASAPHMLIAGATGSGKSVALNTILCSLLLSATPGDMRVIMIDPKRVEMSQYAGLPHLFIPIATSVPDALHALDIAVREMANRYAFLQKYGFRDARQARIPALIIVIDELADLMMTSRKRAEESIVRIAQLGRAAGVHLIVATQKPVVSVVTGLIQANIPCKLALKTSSVQDSVRILGHKGADNLLGMGDALLKLPDSVDPVRMQCAITPDKDILRIVNHWKYNSVFEA